MSDLKIDKALENLKPYKQREFVPEDADTKNADTVRELYEKLHKRDISSSEELEQFLLDRSELESIIGQTRSALYIQMTCHTDDREKAEAYQNFEQNVMPVIELYSYKLDEKYVDAEKNYHLGDDYFVLSRSKKNQVELFKEENIELHRQESDLQQQYQAIIGKMTVEFDGEEKTLQQMGLYLLENDRELREKAWKKTAERRLQDKDALEDIYNKLILVRQQEAANAGFENYRDYAFKSMERFDYSVEDCKQFHKAVEKIIVPMLKDIYDKRKENLGVDELRPWDLQVDTEGEPPLRPFEKTEELVTKVQKIFHNIDPELGSQFDIMNKNGLLDLDSRKGKAPGGYQTVLSEARLPFIFTNAVGVDRDVSTLLHEGGHAFHTFACRDMDILEYRHAPIEFCEVASMSMELIGEEYLGEFYSEQQLNRSIKEHLEMLIFIMSWIATIDAFQHWVYENPKHTSEQRERAWLDIYDRFGGNLVNWEGLESYKTYLWHKQLHLFIHAFYYIEYAIAQLGALGIWENSRKDKNQALADYKKALSLGGSRPLPELFEAAGLKFDMSEKTLRPLFENVQSRLSELD